MPVLFQQSTRLVAGDVAVLQMMMTFAIIKNALVVLHTCTHTLVSMPCTFSCKQIRIRMSILIASACVPYLLLHKIMYYKNYYLHQHCDNNGPQ